MRRALSVGSLAAAVALTVGCHHAPPPTSASLTAAEAAAAAPAPEAVVQPGAPGQASTVVAKVPVFVDRNYTAADVAFMQGMIHHHMQALQMVALIPSHTDNKELHLLGEKIQLTQSDEMKMMKEWLVARGQATPMMMPDGTMMMGSAVMPPMAGMLTPAQMTTLAAARGPAFDRLFLTGMIQHHTGALIMVADLRKNPGSGLEPNIADFVTAVDTDQRMEIDRMNGLLGRPAQ